ncbi:MAG: aromatic acid decarboxylase, partial [Anaerolineae bacterium]|nr:aromatic acid decarboxylase [Anaerolineae bacterium]
MKLPERSDSAPHRLIVGISGASGVIYGIRLLDVLRQTDTIETHLVLTESARITIAQETGWKISEVEHLADVVYKPADIGAS